MVATKTEITEFLDLCPTTWDDAAEWLRRYDTLERAANEFFDKDGILPPETQQNSGGWDENFFHSDRSNIADFGPSNRPASPGFHNFGSIEQTLGEDVFHDELANPAQRQWYAADGRGGVNSGELARRLAQHQQQETGTVDPDGSNFRPARATSYDPSKWAVTVTQTQTTPFQVGPIQRRRVAGDPAFILGTASGSILPHLLTIFHTIPMARNAFIRAIAYPDGFNYDLGPDWWLGDIKEPLISHGADTQSVPGIGDQLLHEGQRLMAFLDKSQRAFASSKHITYLSSPAIGHSAGQESRFLENWEAAALHAGVDPVSAQIFGSTINRSFENESEDEMTDTKFRRVYCMDLQMHGNIQDIYDMVDEQFWSGAQQEERRWMSEAAEILTLRITGAVNTPKDGLGLMLPEVIYADRYLKGAYEQYKTMRDKRKDIEHTVAALERRKVSYTKHWAGQSYPADQLLDVTIKFLQTQMENAQDQRSGPLAAEIMKIKENIEKKVSGIDASIADLRATWTKVGSYLKGGESENEEILKARYTLQGIVTDENILYLRSPCSDSILHQAASSRDWTRIQVDPTSDDLPRIGSIALSVVLEMVKSFSHKVTAIYASDRALAEEPLELPPDLLQFVEMDNGIFLQELQPHEPVDIAIDAATPTSDTEMVDGDAHALQPQREEDVHCGEERHLGSDDDPHQSIETIEW